MIVICPRPPIWVEIYQRLDEVWRHGGCRGDAPPIPLVLAGWIYSSDRDKQQRWQRTIEWAADHDLASLTAIPAEDYYSSENPSTTYLEQHYRLDRFVVRDRPPRSCLVEALQLLKCDWHSIVGEELAAVCEPELFTGAKARRLLVTVFREHRPPWGAWDALSFGPQRETFTTFRKAINDAISPICVDHVDFQIRDSSVRK